MTRLAWDRTGERRFETGVSHGVLYRQNAFGAYPTGEAWNGLTAVTESPSGAEANPQYADNVKYLNLISAEEFGCTIEAYTYPNSFAECDGSAVPVEGVKLGQQARKPFGFSYQTRIGNDVDGTDHGYLIHLVYNALAAPSEKPYASINDSPEAITFSWEVTTTPVDAGAGLKPTATLTIDSTKVSAPKLKELEDKIYGSIGVDPHLPLPADVIAIFSGSLVEAVPVKPTQENNDVTIPTVTGVVYRINGVEVSGVVPITEDVLVTAHTLAGYKFPPVTDTDWLFIFS